MRHIRVGVGFLAAFAGAIPAGALADSVERLAFAHGEDGAYLDPPYAELRHPLDIDLEDAGRARLFELAARRSDVEGLIERQTAVKAQQSRGTCSIFSSTALLESMLAIRQDFDPAATDLSEEWLEYVVMRTKTSEGSTSWANFNAFARQGTVEEELLPYIGETWENASTGLAAERCARLSGTTLKSCLLAHRDPALLTASSSELSNESSPLHDPEFLRARRRANQFARDHLASLASARDPNVGTIAEVKQLLAAGIPVTLDIDFFYGAWNHRLATELTIGRDLEAWETGVVGYPEPGSVDRARSNEKPAGHSVVVVGYDDGEIIGTRVKMTNGSMRDFSYQGVYYIKNSWGTSGYGSRFELNGVPHPGYGVITQKYAHEFGSFHTLGLR